MIIFNNLPLCLEQQAVQWVRAANTRAARAQRWLPAPLGQGAQQAGQAQRQWLAPAASPGHKTAVREVRGEAGKSFCGSGLGCGAATAEQVRGDELKLGSGPWGWPSWRPYCCGHSWGRRWRPRAQLAGAGQALGSGGPRWGSSWPLRPISALRTRTQAS